MQTILSFSSEDSQNNRGLDEGEIVMMEGWLKKRSASKLHKQNHWNHRYFVLRGNQLSAYATRGDKTPKNKYLLNNECTISEVYLSERKKNSPNDFVDDNMSINTAISYENLNEKDILYCCKITWYSKPTASSSTDDEKESNIDVDETNGMVPIISEEDEPGANVSHGNTPMSSSRRNSDPTHRRDKSGSNIHNSPYSSKNLFKKKKRNRHSAPSPPEMHTSSNQTEEEDKPGNDHTGGSGPTNDNDERLLTVSNNIGKSYTRESRGDKSGIARHYVQRMQYQHVLDHRQMDLTMRQIYLSTKHAQQKKNRKRILKGSKYAAVAGAAVTAGVLTAGIGLGIAMVFVGVTAAAGGSGAMAEATFRRGRTSRTLILASSRLDDMTQWRDAILQSMLHTTSRNSSLDRDSSSNNPSNNDSSSTWAKMFVRDGRTLSCATRLEPEEPSSHLLPPTLPPLHTPIKDPNHPTSSSSAAATAASTASGVAQAVVAGRTMYSNQHPHDYENVLLPPKSSLVVQRWSPLEGGWATLLGTGAHGLRMFREETTLHPKTSSSMFRRRSNMRVEGNHGSPLKAHIILNASPLDTFMCLMSHARSESDFITNNGEQLSQLLLPNSGQRASFRVLETLDDHMDIIHLYFRPMYLFPSWTLPRDYVLFRYWRFEPDGSYMVFYDSIQHRDCPPIPGYIRGELHGIYTIAPKKQINHHSKRTSGHKHHHRTTSTTHTAPNSPRQQECMLTQVVQVDPKGWIPTYPILPFVDQGYAEAFSVSALMQMLDVRDALDQDRFVSVSMSSRQKRNLAWRDAAIRFNSGRKNDILLSNSISNDGLNTTVNNKDSTIHIDEPNILPFSSHSAQQSPSRPTSPTRIPVEDDIISEEFVDADDNYDERFSVSEMKPMMSEESLRLIGSVPSPLNVNMWAEPDANSFRVRGKYYKSDKKKINAGNPLMRLIAIDIVECDAPMYSGFCEHPKERVQMALEREREAIAKGQERCDAPPFFFCINIVLAGPPYIHMVCYYAVDDINKINGKDGTPQSKLLNDYIHGDEEFRKCSFKLIPSIVEGNFLVRKAVGSTPCIMGKAIRQLHCQGDRYLEVILDTASSSVAAGVIRLCYGYAKTLVVDMAFLIEGNDESVLPEKVLGCARLKNIEFKNLRFVHSDHNM